RGPGDRRRARINAGRRPESARNRRRVRQSDCDAAGGGRAGAHPQKRGGPMKQTTLKKHDALIAQVLWGRVRALMNEAGATLKRTAFSFPTRESNDFATVLMDVHGNSIAQSSQSIPSFLATLPLTARSMLERRPAEQWSQGDVMLTNDPW